MLEGVTFHGLLNPAFPQDRLTTPFFNAIQEDGDRAHAALPSDTSPARSLAGRRILLVEDEAMIALDIELALLDEGADVVGPVGELQRGLAALDSERVIDAAILDVDLHGEDVYPIAERLKARNVPFLFHTGHASREELTRRFGPVPVCTKPMLAEALVDAIGDLLA